MDIRQYVRSLLLAGLAACATGPVRTSADGAARMNGCLDAEDGLVRLSARCVGPLAWDSALGSIRSHFPKLIESHAYLEGSPIAIWTFRFDSAEVVASQQDDSLNPGRPADYWVVSGPGIVLPGGGRLPVFWGELKRRYSRGLSVSSGELGIQASTCQLPGLDFTLLLDPRDSVVSLDVDAIPSHTRIVQVDLDRGHPPVDSLVAC